jgi:primosomal protein N' (replication factor Y)
MESYKDLEKKGDLAFEEDGRKFVEVVVPLPIHRSFHYRVPLELRNEVQIGKRVIVPFHSRKVVAYCVGFPSMPTKDTKDVIDCIDEEPIISEGDLRFYRWASEYYITPLGVVLKSALPSGLHIEIPYRVTITKDGMNILESGQADPLVLSILKAIREKAFISPLALMKRFPRERITKLTRELEKSGWVGLEEGTPEVRVKPKLERVISLTERGRKQLLGSDEVPSCRLGPTQKKVLDILFQEEFKGVDQLRVAFPEISRIVRSLKEKGMLDISQREVDRDSLRDEVFGSLPEPVLNLQQTEALENIREGIHARSFHPFLLYGITASGKTEIYLQAMKETLRQGRKGMVLVPEISLTRQLVKQFRSRFGSDVAVFHSRLSQGERFDTWRRIKRGDVPIVIGARSALFAPIHPLGIIIVDEEHDSAFKQEETFRYNARDLALVRGKLSGAVVVLGSATPSLESVYNREREKVTFLSLTKRVDDQPLPAVEVVDMKQEGSPKGERPVFSRRLIEAIQTNIERGEGTLLFLNRRGFATFLLCQDCGMVFHCMNCSVALVHHLTEKTIRCHYCNYHIPASPICPSCQGCGVKEMGLGTESLEQEVARLFPDVQIGRMDSDTMARKKSHKEILQRWTCGEIDILTGTQMVAKGHHVPTVTLAGVVLADISLNHPDFRAGERTFQLLTQVAGRAGREGKRGRVIIQTYNPGHYSIVAAKNQDFLAFYEREMALRRELGYPPFSYLVNLRISGTSQKMTESYASSLGEICHELLRSGDGLATMIIPLGPSPAPLFKLRGRYRWQMLLKANKRKPLHAYVRFLLKEVEGRLPKRGVQLAVDVDPVSTL